MKKYIDIKLVLDRADPLGIHRANLVAGYQGYIEEAKLIHVVSGRREITHRVIQKVFEMTYWDGVLPQAKLNVLFKELSSLPNYVV